MLEYQVCGYHLWKKPRTIRQPSSRNCLVAGPVYPVNEDCASEMIRLALWVCTPAPESLRHWPLRGSAQMWSLVRRMRDPKDDGIPHPLATESMLPCFSCAQALRNQALVLNAFCF